MITLLSLLAVTIVLIGILAEPVVAHLARTRRERIAAGGVSLLLAGTVTLGMCGLLAAPQLPSVHGADQASSGGSGSTRNEGGRNEGGRNEGGRNEGVDEALSFHPATRVRAEDLELAELDVEVPPRPDWVNASADMRGDIHRFPVSSDLHTRVQESRNSLNDALLKATNEYIADYLGSNRAPLLINFDLSYIRENLVVDEFTDTVKVSFGPMHQSHALLDFGAGFRRSLRERWEQILTVGRLLKTGVAVGGMLALLGIVFGYFKLDTATRGYYSGRLRFAVGLALLGLLTVAVLFARTSMDWIRWLL